MTKSPSPWLLAIRPKTLPAAVAPVVLGTAISYHAGNLRPLPAVACLAGALLLQIGSNLANDYFDFKKGADTAERLGPVRVTQAGLISERAILTGMVVTFLLATLVGLYLLTVGGLPIVYIGVASIVAAILYTGGPLPYGYKGLGEIFVFAFFGPVAVLGTQYVQTGSITAAGVMASVGSGLLCANVLIVNNLRDSEQDIKADKKTLIARFGRKFGLGLYLANLGLSFAFAAAVGWSLHSVIPVAALLLIPVGGRLYQKVARTDGRALNPLLGETARFQLLFCGALAVSILCVPR